MLFALNILSAATIFTARGGEVFMASNVPLKRSINLYGVTNRAGNVALWRNGGVTRQDPTDELGWRRWGGKLSGFLWGPSCHSSLQYYIGFYETNANYTEPHISEGIPDRV